MFSILSSLCTYCLSFLFSRTDLHSEMIILIPCLALLIFLQVVSVYSMLGFPPWPPSGLCTKPRQACLPEGSRGITGNVIIRIIITTVPQLCLQHMHTYKEFGLRMACADSVIDTNSSPLHFYPAKWERA